MGPSSRVKNNKVKNKRREVGEKNAAKAKKSLDPEQDMVTVDMSKISSIVLVRTKASLYLRIKITQHLFIVEIKCFLSFNQTRSKFHSHNEDHLKELKTLNKVVEQKSVCTLQTLQSIFERQILERSKGYFIGQELLFHQTAAPPDGTQTALPCCSSILAAT